MPTLLRRFSSALGLAVLVVWTGCASPTAAPPLVNLSGAKAAVVEYHDAGIYARELAAAAAPAGEWLAIRAARRQPGERLAVVFDIDETVLSNYQHMLSQDFGYVPAVWQEWVQRAEATALAPVRDVYLRARQLGIEVVFLTGRKEPVDRAPTAVNLAREGLGDYTRLILLPAASTGETAAQRKAAVRAGLEAEGFTLIATIGDQDSDLVGGYAERAFKLPNPFYFIP